jgi:hypothetical protein
MVDLAVPFSPEMSTPPMAGQMQLSSSAFFNGSCPTIPAKGKRGKAFVAMSLFVFTIVY